MSQEKILYESQLVEATPNAPATISPGTGQTDISQYTAKMPIARPIISQTLPAMIGFHQKLEGPTGFVYGFKYRKDTSVTNVPFPYSNQTPPSDNAGQVTGSTTREPADPMTDQDQAGLGGTIPAVLPTATPPSSEDVVITRRLVETDTYEVTFDFTNETIQDVRSFFQGDFPNILSNFLTTGGEYFGDSHIDPIDPQFATFFLPQMKSKAIEEINEEFVNYCTTNSFKLGDATIGTSADLPDLFSIIGEMREALIKRTGKNGPVFILTSPRIGANIVSTLGAAADNGASVYSDRPTANTAQNGFVQKMGDIWVYQHKDLGTGGGTAPGYSEDSGKIIMGFHNDAGPNCASIYHTPYKEYIVEGGADYETGQSKVFYRTRTKWTVNPLDTFDGSLTDPNLNIEIPDESQYLCESNVTFAFKLIS
jgi:hypothetical protein